MNENTAVSCMFREMKETWKMYGRSVKDTITAEGEMHGEGSRF